MALKLTRKAGESIIFKYFDADGCPQRVRILLRKIKKNGDFELDYQSTLNAQVLSSNRHIQTVSSSENVFMRHCADEVLLLNVTEEVGVKFAVRFAVAMRSGAQLRMWFDAPDYVQIIRDELENAA